MVQGLPEGGILPGAGGGSSKINSMFRIRAAAMTTEQRQGKDNGRAWMLTERGKTA
jgi:hypothetical protein